MTNVETLSNTIRILLVDDQNLIRQTIQIYLEQEADLELVDYAENGSEALKKIEHLAPDVAIVDLEMPDMDGLTTIKLIRDRFSHTKILVLSSHDDQDNINKAIKAGAKGYLIKGTPAKELANAIRSVNQGYFQLGPGLMEKLVLSISDSADQNSKSLEDKLIIALKRFKQDTNQQITKLVEAELAELDSNFENNLEFRLHNLKKKYSQLYSYARSVEFKLYLCILFQVITAFMLVVYWIIDS